MTNPIENTHLLRSRELVFYGMFALRIFIIILYLRLKDTNKEYTNTLMGLNFAGIKFRGSLHPQNFDTFAGI